MQSKNIFLCVTKFYISDWQNSVIGLMVFAVTFGFIGAMLSLYGVCSSSLHRKLYCYHSSAEIYFMCGEFSIVARRGMPTIRISI